MKKIGSKITALLMSAVLAVTGCSYSGEDISENGEEITVNTTVSAAGEDTVPKETEALTEMAEVSDIAGDTAESGSEPEENSEETVTGSAQTTASDGGAVQTGSAAQTGSTVGSQSGGSVPQPSGGDSQSTAAASTDEPQGSSQGGAISSGFTAHLNHSNTWEENGNFCGTCELTLSNNGNVSLSGWYAKLNVPDGFRVTNSWNGNFTISDNVLTVTNVDYNKDIPKEGKISFGFNYACPTPFDTPKNVVLGGGVVPEETENDGGEEDNENGGATADPLPAPAAAGLVKDHGKLSVNGTQLVDINGNNFQLKGMSTHGLAWFPGFVNENAFKTLRDDWNTNVIRLAMYSGENGGYCTGGNKEELKALIDKGVQAAAKLGMYVIIDWHVLGDQNPQTYKSEAKAFFEEMSSKYKNYDNVIYEICNEPNGSATWDGDIKPYAEEIIPVIRKNAPDSVIIVGTPTWSQDIDKAAANPLKEKNVLYALHFYAATHTDWLRQRLTDCYNKGLPVFVSEFGTCDASGGGSNDFGQSKQWLTLLDKYGISYCNWNLANKNETSSALRESASADGNWSSGDYSEAGAWIRKWFRGEVQ